MSTRDRIALSVPPLLLRLVLAVTFLWAGLGKALTFDSVSPGGAATLASMGVAVNNSGPPVIVPSPTLPASGGGGAMLFRPPLGIQGAGFQNGGAGSGGAGNTTPPFPADGFSNKPKQDGKPESTKPEQPASPPASDPETKPKNPFSVPAPATTPPAATPPPAPVTSAPAVTTGPIKTAADFPNPEPVRRVYLLALGIHGAANPPALPAGPSGEPAATKMRLLPAEIGQGSRPVYMAFTIAAIEIIAGAMLLLGMLSRVWALAIAFVMMGAIWMTQIGPAMQSGDTFLGFLPNYPWGDPVKWKDLFWQLSLLASAMAVVFAGSGALAVDNAMFGKRADRADLDE